MLHGACLPRVLPPLRRLPIDAGDIRGARFAPLMAPSALFAPPVAPRPHALSSGNYMAPWPHGSTFLAPRDGVLLRVPLCHWRDVSVCACVFHVIPLSVLRRYAWFCSPLSDRRLRGQRFMVRRSACVWSSLASSASSIGRKLCSYFWVPSPSCELR